MSQHLEIEAPVDRAAPDQLADGFGQQPPAEAVPLEPTGHVQDVQERAEVGVLVKDHMNEADDRILWSATMVKWFPPGAVNREPLLWRGLNRLLPQLNDETPLKDKKEFVFLLMLVPVEDPLHTPESHDAVIDLAESLVVHRNNQSQVSETLPHSLNGKEPLA